MQSSAQTGSTAAAHDGQMDRKIKNTSRECADTLPNLFQALKIRTQIYIYTHTHTHERTQRMLDFLLFGPGESGILTRFSTFVLNTSLSLLPVIETVMQLFDICRFTTCMEPCCTVTFFFLFYINSACSGRNDGVN